MKTFLLPCSLLALSLPQSAPGYPPAPHHTIYGMVRNAQGTPLKTGDAAIILSGPVGEVVRGQVDTTIAPGINYMLRVPMDSKKITELYTPTAMLPTMPFTIRLRAGNVNYLPIEMQGAPPALGAAAGTTKLDLTMGVDSDGDGLPDDWEERLFGTGGLSSLADVNPDDDADGDGMSNLLEYIAGTYAFDRLDGLKLEVKDVTDGMARLQFTAITGRTYTLKSTTDGGTWTDQVFSLVPAGTDAGLHYRGESVTLLNVYVPVGTNPSAFFKLYVQ